jgi:hypothetical protein
MHVVFAIAAQSVSLLHSFPENAQNKMIINAIKKTIHFQLANIRNIFFSDLDTKGESNMNLFIKGLFFIIPETAIRFILWKQFISSVLRCKDVVCFADICSHLAVVTEEK